MKDRIRKVMESQHMTQKLFANFINISEGSLSSVFNGRTKPTLQMVDAIYQRIPTLSLDWLLYGTGNMYKDQKAASSNQQAIASDQEEPPFEVTDSSPAPTLFDTSNMTGQNQTPMQTKNIQQTVVKYIDKPQRKITEIRVFFDDQTWETFVPSK